MTEGVKEIQFFDQNKEECQSLFSLKRSNSSPTAPHVSVNFSLQLQDTKDSEPSTVRLVPTFNTDGKFYTPSFILSSEQAKYATNDKGYQFIHARKIQEMEEEKLQMFVPRPSKANSYCCICKKPYDDYLQHVNIPSHKQLMNKSSYCQEIQQLCKRFSFGQPQNCSFSLNSAGAHSKEPKKQKQIKKKPSKSEGEPKRGRGRPKKNAPKIDNYMSIPTNVSICV